MLTLTPPATRPDTSKSIQTKEPVRVCFLIDDLAIAGTETQLLALIRNLDRSRVIPYLCLLRGDSEESRLLDPSNCPVWRLGIRSLARPGTIVQMMRFARFLRSQRIDVLQTYFSDSSYFGIPAAWLAGVPNRLRTRNNVGHWLTPLHRRLGRILNTLTTATLTNCEAARQALLVAEGPQPETVHVLENGIDLGRFLTVLPTAETFSKASYVGTVANLRPVKGVDVLIAAAALLTERYSQVVFQVAGEGEQRPELEASVARHNLVERFLFPGRAMDVPSFLAGLDVVVLPSRAEGMSNALLEYMAAGRPIVATDVGGNRELVEHGVHALLVPPDDPGALARAIGRLLSDRALARRLGTAARQRVHDRFGREAMMHRFVNFYESLRRLDEKRGSR